MNCNKIAGIGLALGMLFLTGCQLARADAGNAGGDRLIGLFVTTQNINLLEDELRSQPNVQQMVNGRSIELQTDLDDPRTFERLYATLTTQTKQNEETGKTEENQAFVFPGVEGISCFAATVIEDGESVVLSEPHEAISDRHVAVLFGDEEEGYELVGTLYLSPRLVDQVYYMNPVYQDSENRVYLLATNGGYMVSGTQSEGQVFAENYKAETTVTEGWKSKKVSFSIDLSLSVLFPSEQIVVLQMDDASKVVLRTEYEPGTLPQNLVPEKDTAYIVVETHKRDTTDSLVVSREVYDPNDTAIETFYCREDGISVKQVTNLTWIHF